MPVSTTQMRVHKYIPDRLYGFTADGEGHQAFFHLGSFDPGPPVDSPPFCSSCPISGCTWNHAPPPPILGELVEVDVDFDKGGGRAPRASKVRRVNPPKIGYGKVETFDPVRGFGFVQDNHGVSYHLHKSEILDGRIPLTGQRVTFYAGVRQGKPRACHVKVCV